MSEFRALKREKLRGSAIRPLSELIFLMPSGIDLLALTEETVADTFSSTIELR
jgi:hypothetical protein